jgi:hypothetical protein
VVPPGARYDAVCSAALTESRWGLQTVAAYEARDVRAARAFYQERGWRVLGGESGYVLVSPDRKVDGTLASTLAAFQAISADVEKKGLQGYDHAKACTGIEDGAGLILSGGADPLAGGDAANSAAAGARLPAALQAAGLTTEQWDSLWAVIVEAASDEMLASQAGALERDTNSPAEAARRRANVSWYLRNRTAVDAAMASASR